METKEERDTAIDEYVAKVSDVVDELDIHQSKNCVLCLGCIEDTFFGQARGKEIDLANMLVHILSQNKILHNAVKNAVDALDTHGDFIQQIVNENYDTTNTCETLED